MTIVPDDKDWTWVLGERCPACGVAAGEIDPAQVGPLVRYGAARLDTLLRTTPDDVLRSRPDPDRWSPLEYACHVRDVFVLYEYRLGLMLDQDDPLFPNWDQDATAVEQDYRSQDPGEVATGLSRAAASVAGAFDRVRPDQWDRPGRRSDGATFTVASFARYFVHDPLHHLVDVGLAIDDRPGG